MIKDIKCFQVYKTWKHLHQGHKIFQVLQDLEKFTPLLVGPKKKDFKMRDETERQLILFIYLYIHFFIERQILFGLYIIPGPRHSSNVRKQWPLRS